MDILLGVATGVAIQVVYWLGLKSGLKWGEEKRKSLENELKLERIEKGELLEENEEMVDLLDTYGHWDRDEDDCEEINVELTDCEKCNGKKEECFPSTCPKEFENGEYLHKAETLTSEQYDALWKQITQNAELTAATNTVTPILSEDGQHVADEVTLNRTYTVEPSKPVTDDTVDFTEQKPVPKLYGQEFKGCCQQ